MKTSSRASIMKKAVGVLTQPIPRRTFLKGLLGVLGIAGIGAGKGYANTTKSHLRLEKVDISLNNLPPSFRGFKIGQLTDLHSSPIGSQESIRHAAEVVMREKPDLIILTGDFIGHSVRIFPDEIHEFDPHYVTKLTEAFSLLKAPLGIYGVLGNHDFWSGPQATQVLVQELESKLGVQWLRNRNVTLEREGQTIALAGVDDYWEESCSLEQALDGVGKDTTCILLSHNPDINEIMFDFHRVDLIISGHTHGGQVIFPIIGPPFKPGIMHLKYMQGLVRDGHRQTYTSRGVGHLVAPIRFNCPPEVTLFTSV